MQTTSACFISLDALCSLIFFLFAKYTAIAKSGGSHWTFLLESFIPLDRRVFNSM